MGSSINYPFIYLGHGIAYFRKSIECYICFENELDSEQREMVENIIPDIFTLHVNWEHNVVFISSDDELPFIVYHREGSLNDEELEKLEDEAFYKEVFDAEIWKNFNAEIDEFVLEIHEKFPIKFFIKCLDYEHNFNLDQWHEWSVAQIYDKILLYLYNNYETLNNLVKLNDNESILVPWYLNQVLLFYIDHYEFDEIPSEENEKIIEIINLYSGFDDYIDSYNSNILGNILLNYDEDKVKSKVKLLHPQVQFSLFSSSPEEVQLLKMFDNPLEYIIELIELNPAPVEAELLYRIGQNIANVSFEHTKDGIDVIVIENEGSDLLLGAHITELGLDLNGCDQEIYLFLIQIYNYLGMLDRSIELIKKAMDCGINEPMIITGLLYALLQSEKKEDVDFYLNDFLKDVKIIGNPYSLSNILYALNIKSDSNASDIAIDLTKEYWRSPNKQMLSSLYINMTNTFIVAGELDETLDDIIKQTKKIINEDSDFFNPHEYIVYENLACYYGMKNDKENTIASLVKAREFSHPEFDTLVDLEQFSSFKNDLDFQEVFK